MFTGRLRAAYSRSRISRPCRPIDSFNATSSSAIACASFHAVVSRSESFTGARRWRIRPIAHARFTAVGRVVRNRVETFEIDSSDGSRATASAIPKAAATPISGAPRTRMLRIASAIASAEAIVAVSKTCGSRVWSMMWTTPWDSSAQRER